MYKRQEKFTPATIEFVDIAGLVKGASKGEGLGNKFLSNIREVDAIVHVVRCFENDDIIHVEGSICLLYTSPAGNPNVYKCGKPRCSRGFGP